MRVANLQMRAILLAGLVMAASSCQTAQKPVALLPPGKAPSLKASAATPAPKTVEASQPAVTAAAPQPEAQTQKPKSEETTASEQPPAAPAHDAITDLIARVEKEYQAGLTNYKAGNTDAARKNFDDAINALLGSNLD